MKLSVLAVQPTKLRKLRQVSLALDRIKDARVTPRPLKQASRSAG